MSTVNFTLVRDDKGRSLTVYVDKDGEFKTHTLSESHNNFQSVLDYLLNTDPEDVDATWVTNEVDTIHAVGTKLNGISERVRVTETTLLFDGDPINNVLTDHIIRLVREGDSAQYAPLVAFLEKVRTNPSADSIDSLYSWLLDRKFSITPDGDFIAYKGVALDKDGNSISINHGRAIADGVVYNGAIPNKDGSVIEMPRSQVQADTAIGCASGLHAGTWNYAAAFARGRVLVVKINPRDVVSVPNDCSFQKLRVSRYVVLSAIDQEYAGTTYDTSDVEDEDYDEYEEDNWYDGDDEDDY